MKSCFDNEFKYTPVKDQGPDYLKRKFDKLRRELEAKKKANAQEVADKVRRLA